MVAAVLGGETTYELPITAEVSITNEPVEVTAAPAAAKPESEFKAVDATASPSADAKTADAKKADAKKADAKTNSEVRFHAQTKLEELQLPCSYLWLHCAPLAHELFCVS